HVAGEAMDRRFLAEDLLEPGRIHTCDLGSVEPAETLLELPRAEKRGLRAHLLVEDEADQQRERVVRDQLVRSLVVREVERIGHAFMHRREMRVAVLGAGVVGQTLAGKLRELGHEVQIGTRNPRDDAVSYAEAAGAAEVVLNATNGLASLEALEAAGGENLAGKLLIDVSNALDFGKGRPPAVGVGNDDSIAERIQRAHPDAKVVKTLNTVNNQVMVNPAAVPGDHVLFVCGNEDEAKKRTVELLGSFSWPAERVIDLGDITAARAVEMYVALWVRLT